MHFPCFYYKNYMIMKMHISIHKVIIPYSNYEGSYKLYSIPWVKSALQFCVCVRYRMNIVFLPLDKNYGKTMSVSVICCLYIQLYVHSKRVLCAHWMTSSPYQDSLLDSLDNYRAIEATFSIRLYMQHVIYIKTPVYTCICLLLNKNSIPQCLLFEGFTVYAPSRSCCFFPCKNVIVINI